jgi:mannose-6-phosphate isomerase-like protein (cupin superfamily)
MSRSAALTIVLSSVVTGLVVAQQPAPPATYVTEAELAAATKKALEANPPPTMTSARVTMTDQYRASLIRRTAPAGAIVHADGHEIHHITDGAGTLVTGGTVIRSEGRGGASRIEGGVTKRVAKGDVIVIPVNTPHQYTAVEGSISYLEIRFPPVNK